MFPFLRAHMSIITSRVLVAGTVLVYKEGSDSIVESKENTFMLKGTNMHHSGHMSPKSST